ncbi:MULTISPECIES: DNA-methyltransferase [unclassified Plantibacter]|uniref:DNA-methyltransferase n=1 Tax=unclassified Plantibacter TaxID=2624265 RepID=UPI0009EC2031|nr:MULTISPECIES: DNA methyltransferase [unclassified Plantibacter]
MDARAPFQFERTVLVNEDCLTWLKKAEPSSISSVVTDPPYGADEYTATELERLRSGGRGGVWRIPPSYDGHTRSPLPRFSILKKTDLEYLHDYFEAWATLLLPVLKPGAHIFLACNPLISPYISTALSDAGLERRGEVVRRVMTMRGGDRPKNAHHEFDDVSVMPRSQWEPWLLYRRPIDCKNVAENLRRHGTGGLRRISDARPFGDVIMSGPTGTRERRIAAHPSLKPQAFLRQIVRASLPLGKGTVLDTFAGSGSTLAAAAAVGYEAVGLERDSEYASLATKAVPQLAQLVVKDDSSIV